MATVSLYVNTEVSTGVWTTVGTAPYLSTQNQPTDYIHSIGRNSDSGVYGFADSADLGTISSVVLYIYAYGAAPTNFTTVLNATDTGLGPPAAWGWVNVNVTAIISTWAAINAATCYFDRPNTTDNAGVDCAYLLVTYAGVAKVGGMAGTTSRVGETVGVPIRLRMGLRGTIGSVTTFINTGLHMVRKLSGIMIGSTSILGSVINVPTAVIRYLGGIVASVTSLSSTGLQLIINLCGTVSSVTQQIVTLLTRVFIAGGPKTGP